MSVCEYGRTACLWHGSGSHKRYQTRQGWENHRKYHYPRRLFDDYVQQSPDIKLAFILWVLYIYVGSLTAKHLQKYTSFSTKIYFWFSSCQIQAWIQEPLHNQIQTVSQPVLRSTPDAVLGLVPRSESQTDAILKPKVFSSDQQFEEARNIDGKG